MIGLYEHSLEPAMTIALAALILVIGGLRTMAIIYSPEKYLEKGESHHG
jgi:uncharacterized membrane protein